MKKAAALLLVTIFLGALHAEETEQATPQQSPIEATALVQTNEEGVALNGFDVVSYFSENQAKQGLDSFSCEYNNTIWHFSSEQNRDEFLANPDKYLPQYGGYCAHSLSNNQLVKANPEVFSVRDNELYFYANQRVLEKDIDVDNDKFNLRKKKRDRNWLELQREF